MLGMWLYKSCQCLRLEPISCCALIVCWHVQLVSGGTLSAVIQ